MIDQDGPVRREQLAVNGTDLSYLVSGDEGAPPLLLLHGTFWSRVWQPVLPALGKVRRCIALDLPGFGRSSGELDVGRATIPALAATVLDAADELGITDFDLAAHDIGGGIAQHIAATSGRVKSLVLMNSVMFDSWPVPAVLRFRDPDVRAATSGTDLLSAREISTRGAVARQLRQEEVDDYLSPWREPARQRSWMAMAAAADPRYTMDVVPALQRAAIPTRLVWGRDDDFQKVSFARRYVKEIPNAELTEVPGKHIPTEDSPKQVTEAIRNHLEAHQ
ncbi:alpha/beta fold hydrolase [Paeniglutamicibacter antarcticus]|uniref:Alpha/beta fold hydrolase n=1 Tax=Arthrobacter terrae TaxID=2935737 RepID=A0A931CM78_9MICC|nr:alpha/beta fold hydrolase [Arthrobacter terrae]MBG0738019.1 alpha/beta fold hydrolase [Arthrobacter terrae]